MFILVRFCAVVRNIGAGAFRTTPVEEVPLRPLLASAPGSIAEQMNSLLPDPTVASTVVHHHRCIMFFGGFGGRVSVLFVSLE